ncbi:MAG: ComEC/Rec2 family competence protein, partial [Gemmatimonadota bacterium]|nr:ComEC/Rec2 family competence protein [Gemmatimonadota bacterium]
LFVRGATLSPAGYGSALIRWRSAAGDRVDALFGADAPLARALLVADQRGIPPAMRDRYAAAGIAHMLSISGLHVALIAMAMDLLFQLMRLPRRRANLATVIIVAAYVAMLGAPPPALRSAVMLAAWLWARWRQRPTPPWAVLAIGAALPLTDPRAVTAVGYQLSVAGVAALVAAARLARRWPWMARQRGVRRGVLTTVLASTMATVVSAPLVAWNFGRLSLIGPLTNVVAGPVIGLAQPIMFLALLLAPVAPLARWLADAAHPLLRAFDAIATAAAAVPGAAIAVAPSAATATLGAVLAVSLIVACASRFPARPLLAAAAALALMVWVPVSPIVRGEAELHAIDTGQGYVVALRSARGRWVLFDAGAAWRGGDAGRGIVAPYIAHRGGALDAFVLTSAGAARAGGAASVLRVLRPRRFLDAAGTGRGADYAAALAEARRDGIPWRQASAGDTLRLDELLLEFVSVDTVRGGAIVRVHAGDGAVRMIAGNAAARTTAPEEPIVIRADGRALRVDTGRDAWPGPVRPSRLHAVRAPSRSRSPP